MKDKEFKVLNFLQEIHESEGKEVAITKLLKKHKLHPTISSVCVKNNLYKKHKKEIKWLSIKPNIYMAETVVIKAREHQKNLTAKYKAKKIKKVEPSTNVELNKITKWEKLKSYLSSWYYSLVKKKKS
jgi:hypothetical protein